MHVNAGLGALKRTRTGLALPLRDIGHSCTGPLQRTH